MSRNKKFQINNLFKFFILIFFLANTLLLAQEQKTEFKITSNPNIIDYASTTKTEMNGNSGILPFRRMGLATGGESFGFLLEFLFPGKNEIIENPFYSNTIIDRSIYNITYNDKGDSLPSKVGIPGGVTRFAWTYSF